MPKWDYFMQYARVTYTGDKNDSTYGMLSAARLWSVKDNEGLTAYDRMQRMGREGWELVSAVPTSDPAVRGGYGEAGLLFIYKRPVPNT